METVRQVDEVAVGLLLGPTLANALLAYVEKNEFRKIAHQVSNLIHYCLHDVDDIFVFLPQQNV